MTVYLVLPADRLDTFSRWLRMMIQQAITVNARNIKQKPDKPILFMLDEVAALGKMPVIPRAYGLMAGYGMMLWSIVQNWKRFTVKAGRRLFARH
jgi:type IV secretion system protein VirD4